MDYLDEYSEHNPKTKLDAESYVDSNLYRLIQMMNIDEEDYDSKEDVKKVLIEYFTRFPDKMAQININTFGIRKILNLSLNNIGGGGREIKYK